MVWRRVEVQFSRVTQENSYIETGSDLIWKAEMDERQAKWHGDQGAGFKFVHMSQQIYSLAVLTILIFFQIVFNYIWYPSETMLEDIVAYTSAIEWTLTSGRAECSILVQCRCWCPPYFRLAAWTSLLWIGTTEAKVLLDIGNFLPSNLFPPPRDERFNELAPHEAPLPSQHK